MNVLALDPATRTGFAHSDGASGTWNLSIRPGLPSGKRLVKLWAKLNEAAAVHGVDLIVFEEVRYIGTGYARALIVQLELQGALKLWCELRDVPFRAVGAPEVKKHATQKGNAKKEQMVAAARRRWPDKDITDDNEADALWILDMATNPPKQPLFEEAQA